VPATTLVYEMWGEFSSSKSYMDFYDALPADYSAPYLLDTKPPQKTVGLTAKGVTYADMMVEQALLDTPGVKSFTLADGNAVNGRCLNFKASPIEHTGYYNISIAVRVDGVGSLVWHYWGEFSSSKELMEFYGAPPDSYAAYTLVDGRPPRKTVGLSAHGATLAESIAVMTLMDTPLGSSSFSTGDGATVDGIITSANASPIEHTGLYNLRVTLRTDGSSEVLWVYYGKISSSKPLGFFDGAPVAGPAYGARLPYDQVRPMRRGTISAEAIPHADALAILAKHDAAPGVTHAFSIVGGDTITGIIENIEIDPIRHTPLWNASVTVWIS
jgi:hypothetical protein